MTPPLLAAVELGGTKTIVAVGHAPDAMAARHVIPTTTPEETLGSVSAFLKSAADRFGRVEALGIASFGPLDLRTGAATHGCLLETPKDGWSGAPVLTTLKAAAACPAAIDTDVNAAALGEARWGAGRGVADLAYVTVGTGIGSGLLLDGRLRHGLLHPEIGHLRLRRHDGDDFPGNCPFHGDCLEGLASGPAIAARLGGPLDTFNADHPFHAVLVDYLGQLCATLLLVVSVERIVIGGGVVAKLQPHRAIAEAMRKGLAGYLDTPLRRTESFIVPPLLVDSGLAGAFALAEQLACVDVGTDTRGKL